MRVVFMGTPVFSVGILDAVVKAGHEVVCVYSQPPRPAGRGKQLRPSPVQARAEQLGLQTRHPTSLKTAEVQEDFAALNADIAVVVAYGLLLPQEILDAPKRGCLNIHASLLPRWRGAAPIHRAIMAGDEKTGVCIMQMETGLDTGPVLLVEDTPIRAGETTGQLHDRLSKLGAELIVGALDELDVLRPVAQSSEGITYAKKITKAEARVNWSYNSAVVDRSIRALSPFPGAWCDMNGERVKLLHSELADGVGEPGQVLDGLTIACGRGAVRITKAQRQGKQPMLAEEFLKGFKMPARLSQATHPNVLPFAKG